MKQEFLKPVLTGYFPNHPVVLPEVETDKANMSLDVENIPKPEQLKCMSKCRIIKNLIVASLGFFFLFCAIQSLSNLQTTINRQGSMSQSLIYGALALSSLLLPKMIISKLGCKTTLVVSILLYIPFMASNYFGDFLALLLTSIVAGVGGGTLWSSGSTYINEISVLYSSYGTESVDVITTRFFGIFFMIFQNSQIWGNLVTFYVLKPSHSETFEVKLIPNGSKQDGISATHIANTTATCGVHFCGGLHQNVSQLPDDKRFILVTVYLAFTILAALVVAAFLDPFQPSDTNKDTNILFTKLIATLKHLRKPNQLLLLPLTIFVGLQQAFILSEYSQGYIACAWGLYNVSLVFICYGVVSAIAAFLTGRISKYVPRVVIILTAAAGNVAACTIMFLWTPDSNDALYFFITIALWGMSDAIWQTQVSSMYGILFREDEEAAFGNLRLWEAIGFFIPYFCNKRLCMFSKLNLVIAVLATSLGGYVVVEIRTSRKKTFVPKM